MNAVLTRILAVTASLFFASTHADTPRTIYQFPNPTWLENIAAMRNGSLLVTVTGRPEVHIVNPLVTPSVASLVAIIPDTNAVFGITELYDNVFAVAAGNSTPDNAPVRGSFSVWSIDLTHDHGIMEIGKIADVPGVGMINGLAALNSHTLLLADSWKGNVASLDVKTGKSSLWLDDKSTASNFSAPGLPLGVNGIKVHRDWVYYSNTVQSSLNRIRLDRTTSAVVNDVETLAQGDTIAVPDDFAVLKSGSVILGRPLSDEVMRVRKDRKKEIIAKVEGITAAALGRAEKNKDVVYLSSMGGFNINGSVKAGGRIVAVQLR
ncbi:hypothetical protein N0V87_008540 [Didymella glomerata]|jgi:hypothetical protein|uniref:Uncharacterized protein n=1 Tax=Didymella glomerata TaxID=749621 RepID=A0A9W9BXW2_9PLEO|nr:hypothetical protein N0V87_008540 [Didymella glomerata]